VDRLGILNSIASKNNAQSYLEIGVFAGYTFDNVCCKHKVGVDPDKSSKATIFSTSDTFFTNNKETFDLIFIDGLHHADQVEKDIQNALEILNPNGYIVCHDMLPPEEACQIVPMITYFWTGDCWKAWARLRSMRDDLHMKVVDTDFGCGIIKRGSQKTITLDCELTWDNFLKNRQQWMNVISVQDFKKELR
jgi:SAM-dependent methyltransferase